MAERRTQIKELDIPSMSSVTPTASPVETYVRPEREQVQPSALSQFVSAITPAIKADSDERLRKTLEREQKIQDGRFKNQVNELGQYALQVGFNLKKDFEKNSEHYFSLRDDVDGTAAEKFLAIRQGYIDENVERLEQEGVDEILVQEFKNRMQEYNTEFLAKVYLPGREEIQKKDRKNRFTTSLSIILETVQDRQDALEKINDAYLRHVDANWGNHAETLDTLWKYAEEISLYNADNALVDWLKSPQSSPEGQPAQWLVGKRAGQRATIESRILKQAKENEKLITEALTAKAIETSVAQNYGPNSWGNLPIRPEGVRLQNGKVVKITADHVAPYVDAKYYEIRQNIKETTFIDEETKKARLNEAATNRLNFYSNYNRTPPEISQVVNNSVQYLFQGDIENYPERLAAVEKMYKTLVEADAQTSGSISAAALTREASERFKYLKAMVNVGMDFQKAVASVQGPLYEGRSIKLEKDELKQFLDYAVVLTSPEAKANNLFVMEAEVKSVAEAILKTGAQITEEEAKAQAFKLVLDDYQFIENKDGSTTALRIESNALNSAVNVEQIEQGILEVNNDRTIGAYIEKELGVEGTTIRPSTFGAGGYKPGFDLYLRESGNPNQYYLIAKPEGEDIGTTQSIVVTTVNLWDFNANRIQGLKDQVLQKYRKAVEDGMIADYEPEVAVDTFYNLDSVAPSDGGFVETMERAIGDNGVPYPPVRPEELGGGASLTVPERRLSNAQIRQDERIQRSLDLNREALSEEVVTDEGSSSWIRSIGSAIGKAIFGGEAQSAELESTVAQSLDKAATNPLEFVLNNRYLGLSEKDPDHQKTIAGFMNRAVKGRVKNPSDMQLDSNAWCAAFAGHVLSSLGIASPQRYDALRARSYLKVGRGISIDKAQPGDLVVMKTRLRNGKTQWHAGFFVEHDGGKTFKLLGGNQKDQVNVQNNTVANIAGIRRINNVQNIKPDALKAIQRDMTFFGKLQNFLAGYRAK